MKEAKKQEKYGGKKPKNKGKKTKWWKKKKKQKERFSWNENRICLITSNGNQNGFGHH